MILLYTVELRSKGPGRKGNPPIRERISSPIHLFPFFIYDAKILNRAFVTPNVDEDL